MPGQRRFASIKSAGSETMIASGLSAASSSKYFSASFKSLLCARIFAVTKTRLPLSCAKRSPSAISSGLKFFAFARSPKASPPM